VTDWVDGPLARRGPPTRHGALLDNLADVAVVLAGTITGAVLGLVPGLLPGAIGVSFGAYLRASLAGSSPTGWRPARSRLGHAAGVLNYAVVLAIAGAVALPEAPFVPLLPAAGVVVAGVNAGAVVARMWDARAALTRRAPP
jgi:phosphatidylglycerophosphate synthase